MKYYRRRYLKEELGQSTSLDLFANQLVNGTYNPFWRITLKANGITQENYFSVESGAKNYYNMILKSFKDNPEDYENAEVSLDKITIPDITIDNIEFETKEEDIEEDEILDFEEIEL